jgi:hypothetical protein
MKLNTLLILIVIIELFFIWLDLEAIIKMI